MQTGIHPMIKYLVDWRVFRTAVFMTFCLLLLLPSGCSRRKYRLAADRQAYDLVAEKSNDPRWAIQPWSVYSDPRSRYYDPYNPDRPPMPPDDPASHQYMVRVAGIFGYVNRYLELLLSSINPGAKALFFLFTRFYDKCDLLFFHEMVNYLAGELLKNKTHAHESLLE